MLCNMPEVLALVEPEINPLTKNKLLIAKLMLNNLLPKQCLTDFNFLEQALKFASIRQPLATMSMHCPAAKNLSTFDRVNYMRLRGVNQ